MTPLDLFSWALAIAVAWGVITHFMPFDQWLGTFFARRHTRLKALETRLAELEQHLTDKSAVTPARTEVN